MGLDWTGSPIPWVLLAAFSAGIILAYWKDRPGIVLGLLFMAGTFSAVTVPVGGSNLRLEMVAVPVLAILVVFRERETLGAIVRRLKVPIALAGTYVASNLVSSLLFSPAPDESVKIVVWLAMSVAACFLAAALTWGRGQRVNLGPWIIAAAVVQVAVALVAVFSQAAFDTTWGVMARDVLLGKAYGLSWEANILSINIAMALPFLVWVPPQWRLPQVARILLLAFLSIGLGLAASRGGVLAFGVGTACALVLSYRSRAMPILAQRKRTLSTAAYVGAVLVVAIGTMAFLDFAGERIAEARSVVVVRDGSGECPDASQVSGPDHACREVGTGDTWAIRWRNMTTAVSEVTRNPSIGLGTDSYPMRHIEPSCNCPAFINNLTVAVLYESGVVGVLALAGFVGYVLFSAWRLKAWPYLAAVVAMVVGYQFTDAIRFESNWILMGVVLGFMGSGVAGTEQPEPD